MSRKVVTLAEQERIAREEDLALLTPEHRAYWSPEAILAREEAWQDEESGRRVVQPLTRHTKRLSDVGPHEHGAGIELLALNSPSRWYRGRQQNERGDRTKVGIVGDRVISRPLQHVTNRATFVDLGRKDVRIHTQTQRGGNAQGKVYGGWFVRTGQNR